MLIRSKVLWLNLSTPAYALRATARQGRGGNLLLLAFPPKTHYIVSRGKNNHNIYDFTKDGLL